MPNAHERELLHEMRALSEQMIAAIKTQDWDALGGIDLRVRGCLQSLAQVQLQAEEISPELQQMKDQLQQLYGKVIPVYRDVCEKLRVLLLNHVDHAEGRSAYLRTELLQGNQ